jgi:hypothetical protein
MLQATMVYKMGEGQALHILSPELTHDHEVRCPWAKVQHCKEYDRAALKLHMFLRGIQ